MTMTLGRPRAVESGPQGVDVSVLVPANDEAENLPLFLQLCDQVFRDTRERYEVIVVDDGSVDDTARVLGELKEKYPFVRSVRHRSRRGDPVELS